MEPSEVDLMKSTESDWVVVRYRELGNSLDNNGVSVEFWKERGFFAGRCGEMGS